MPVSAELIEKAIRERLQAEEVTVLDTSGGCGASFDVAIASPLFEGKRLLQRHQLINEALKEEIAQAQGMLRNCYALPQLAILCGAAGMADVQCDHVDTTNPDQCNYHNSSKAIKFW
eukprot:jgi/Mesvir1/24050/Mv10783-RA.1